MRTIQQSLAMPRFLKRFEGRRSLVAQHSRQQPRHRIDHHRRRQLAAAQHIIADRNLFIRQVLRHALVHAFVAAADQQQFRALRSAVRHRLIEHAALRRKQHHFLARTSRSGQIDSTACEHRLAASAPCPRRRRTAGHPPSCAGRVSSRADCGCGSRAGPASLARFTTPCANGPAKNSGKIVSTWKITGGSNPSDLRAIPPRSAAPPDRSPRRSTREGNQQIAVHYQQPGAAAILPARDLAQRFAGAPVDYLAADQIGLEILARLERRRALDGNAHFRARQPFGIGDGIDARGT